MVLGACARYYGLFKVSHFKQKKKEVAKGYTRGNPSVALYADSLLGGRLATENGVQGLCGEIHTSDSSSADNHGATSNVADVFP